MTVSSLKLSLYVVADEIEQHPEFESSIRLHYLDLLTYYSKRPFFYKNALKLNRLMVSFSLLSHYFNSSFPLLSRVKEFCVGRNYCSKNSLESMFMLFRAMGFMEVGLDAEDGRLRVFKPTVLACKEVRGMLASQTGPLSIMCCDGGIVKRLPELDDHEFLSVYFKGFAIILAHDLTIDTLMPECHWLVKRDAGHMLMLAIYNDACIRKNEVMGFRTSSYLTLATELSVSKTHVIRFIREGADRGYFKIHSKTILEVLPAFMQAVRRFMALSFSIGLHSVKLSQGEKNIGSSLK